MTICMWAGVGWCDVGVRLGCFFLPPLLAWPLFLKHRLFFWLIIFTYFCTWCYEKQDAVKLLLFRWRSETRRHLPRFAVHWELALAEIGYINCPMMECNYISLSKVDMISHYLHCDGVSYRGNGAAIQKDWACALVCWMLQAISLSNSSSWYIVIIYPFYVSLFKVFHHLVTSLNDPKSISVFIYIRFSSV
jgi:hypothetical protein